MEIKMTRIVSGKRCSLIDLMPVIVDFSIFV